MESKHHHDEDKGSPIKACDSSSKGFDSDNNSSFSSSKPSSSSPSCRGGGGEQLDQEDIVGNFIAFTSSLDFVNTVQYFYRDNCDGFESYTELLATGCGLKLEWMDAYKRFMDIVDEQLNKFCEIYSHLTAKQVFDKLQESMDQASDAAYVPLLIQSLDEQYFFSQMSSHARRKLLNISANPSSAADSKEDSKVELLSRGLSPFDGMWFADKNSFNAQFDNWLGKIGVPWAFRKVISLAYSSRSGGSEFRINRETETLTLTSIIPVIGTHMAFFHFDKEWKREIDPRGETYTTYCDFISETQILTKIKRKKFSGNKAEYLVISEFILEADAGPNRTARLTNNRTLFLDCDESKPPDAVLQVYLYR